MTEENRRKLWKIIVDAGDYLDLTLSHHLVLPLQEQPLYLSIYFNEVITLLFPSLMIFSMFSARRALTAFMAATGVTLSETSKTEFAS